MSMKVYLMVRNDEKLYPNNLLIVSRLSEAEKVIEDGFADYYEIVDVLVGDEINDIYQRFIGRG